MITLYRSSDQRIQLVYLVVIVCLIVIGASMIGFFLVIATMVVVLLDICLLSAFETFGYLDDGRKVMDMFVGPL